MNITKVFTLILSTLIISATQLKAENNDQVLVSDTTNVAVATKEVTTKSKPNKPKKYWGSFSGSFETNTILYVDDEKTGAITPENEKPYGSNNYLKLDYRYKGFSAGIQAEYYPQVLRGYDSEYSENSYRGLASFGDESKNDKNRKFAVPMKYISWQNNFMSVTLGDFYEQFGSGLILRSWEDRALGLNNSLGGARVTFNIKDIARIKVLSAVPRDYMYYSRTLVSGADLSVSLSNLLKLDNHNLSIEGSVVDKYTKKTPEGFTEEDLGLVLPKHVVSYSARVAWDYNGFLAKYEYAGKTKDLYDDKIAMENILKKGESHLVELGYSGNGLSVSSVFRYLSNMVNPIYYTDRILVSNTLNYIPSLTQMQPYALASMKPYSPQSSEYGGQLDVFYRVKRGTLLGGKRGMKVHANFSMYFAPKGSTMYSTPEGSIPSKNDEFLYGDLTFDVEKSWNRKLSTIFMVSLQRQAASFYFPDIAKDEYRSTFIADITYKFSRKFSLRTELQYLYAPITENRVEGDGDWVAALIEFNIAPKWSIFVSDMYNHGKNKNNVDVNVDVEDENPHYLSGGVSFTHSIIRASFSYGRNKAGYVCSGGVCRTIPAYTGGNLSIVLTF